MKLIDCKHGHAVFGCDYCALVGGHAINCPLYWANHRAWTRRSKALRAEALAILEATNGS